MGCCLLPNWKPGGLSYTAPEPLSLPRAVSNSGRLAHALACRQLLHDHRGRWQEGRPLRENLEAVLELQLPQRGQGPHAEDASADCAICYAYRLPAAEEGAEGGWVPGWVWKVMWWKSGGCHLRHCILGPARSFAPTCAA